MKKMKAIPQRVKQICGLSVSLGAALIGIFSAIVAVVSFIVTKKFFWTEKD